MIFGSPVKKCSKQLASFYEEKRELNDKYQDIIEKSGCESCDNYNHGNVDSLEERFKKCDDCKYQKKVIEIANRLEKMNSDIDAFIENEYAKAVFEKYNKEKPMLKLRRGGEKTTWNDAFGDDFEKVSKSLRHSLVGLVEGEGRYTL